MCVCVHERYIRGLSRHVIWKRDIDWRRYKIQETLYIGQCRLSPLQSRHLGTSQFSQLPSAALSYFPESHWQSEISSLSKVILAWGKARSHRVPNMGCKGSESPGWFNVLPKNSAWDMVHWVGVLSWWSCQSQLPIGVVFWIIRIASTEECSSLTQNLIQSCCSTR